MARFVFPSNSIRAVSVLLLLSFHGGLIISGQDEYSFPHSLQQHNDSSSQHHHHPSINCSDNIPVPLCAQHHHHCQYHDQQQQSINNEGTAESHHPDCSNGTATTTTTTTTSAAAAATIDTDGSNSDISITIAAILGEDGRSRSNSNHHEAVYDDINLHDAATAFILNQTGASAEDNATDNSTSSSSTITSSPSSDQHHYSGLEISTHSLLTGPAMEDSPDQHDHHHHHPDNDEHIITNVYVISNELRTTTPPPGGPSPIHTASPQSVWRPHSHEQHHSSSSLSSSSSSSSSSPDLLDIHEHSTASFYLISNELRRTTPPPGGPSPIHTASPQSVWRAGSQNQQHHSSPCSSSSFLDGHPPCSDAELHPSDHTSDDHLITLSGSSSDDAQNHEQTLHSSS